MTHVVRRELQRERLCDRARACGFEGRERKRMSLHMLVGRTVGYGLQVYVEAGESLAAQRKGRRRGGGGGA